jgi:ATP-dependent phosphofructokinase / diphosphate-dependent phosphofructokinase
MNKPVRLVAINIGGGYVPGINSVITGAVLAANELGWGIVGIRDGFDGLLFPERYPEGGLVPLTPRMVRQLSATGAVLGTAPRSDPFRVRTVNADNQIEEIDRSDELLAKLRAEKIDAVISVVSSAALSVLFRLHRKGLAAVCVPKSAENDVAGTLLSFGFNSTLSYTVDTLERAREAAESARRIGVVEVLGDHSGWLALQAGMAARADAVLIPEIPFDLRKIAEKFRAKAKAGEEHGLVVVAAGATAVNGSEAQPDTAPNPLKASLAPLATGPEGAHVIDQSGRMAHSVALQLQRLTDQQTYPLVLGQLAKGGPPTAVDRQLGLGYGAGAVRAIQDGQCGVMVAFQPPDLKFVPLAEAINKIRTVPRDSLFVQLSRSLGIALGD